MKRDVTHDEDEWPYEVAIVLRAVVGFSRPPRVIQAGIFCCVACGIVSYDFGETARAVDCDYCGDGGRAAYELSHLSPLVAFYRDHQRCGELETGVDDKCGWMTCTLGAAISPTLESARCQQPPRRPMEPGHAGRGGC